MSEPFEIDDRVVTVQGVEALILRVQKGRTLVRYTDGVVQELPLSELQHSKQTRIWPMLDVHPITGEHSPLAPDHPRYRKPKT
jgi:hypothetical protein